jgi:predicted metal-dependent hydrolase
LKQKNHSKKFRALVETFCPDYKETKKQLRKFIIKTPKKQKKLTS